MADGLEDFWSKLTLTDSKQCVIHLDKEWVANTARDYSYALIGKLFSRKLTNIPAMRSVLGQVWKLKHGLQINEIGEKIYMFPFDDTVEREKIIQNQPWSFNKSLLLLQKVDTMTRPDALRILNSNTWSPNGAYTREHWVGVMINITKPLRRGTWLAIGDEDKVLVLFKYESLLDFCYVCGRLDHHESECNDAVQMKKLIGMV
ncbi:hypothetical protein REPUB_Repub10bG0104600 [Reevesia pubescens]